MFVFDMFAVQPVHSQNQPTSLSISPVKTYLINFYWLFFLLNALYMHCNHFMLILLDKRIDQLWTRNTVCVWTQPYLFMFAAAEAAPGAGWLARQTQTCLWFKITPLFGKEFDKSQWLQHQQTDLLHDLPPLLQRSITQMTDRSLCFIELLNDIINCTLLSLAAIRRLFSIGGRAKTCVRDQLLDGNFERLLLLKANKWTEILTFWKIFWKIFCLTFSDWKQFDFM